MEKEGLLNLTKAVCEIQNAEAYIPHYELSL